MTPERHRLEEARAVLSRLVAGARVQSYDRQSVAHISAELVPRDVESLEALLDFLDEALPPPGQ